MTRIYQHFRNGKQYDFVGVGQFSINNSDTLTPVARARYSEDPKSILTVYRMGGTYVLQQIEGQTPVPTDLEYVLYQARYDHKELGSKVLWARPKEDFFGTKEHEGKRVPRFKLATPEEVTE